MKKNVGTVDAIGRITFGLTGLAWATAKMVRHPYRTMPMICALLSAMKVAEGITRYCPMLDYLGVSTAENKGRKTVIVRKNPETESNGSSI
jgi:hypothetical protein